jgi:hypothetical protein
MAKSREGESDRNVRAQTIELQINVCSSYMLLAKNARDPDQALVFRSRARAAYEEARSLLQLAPLLESEESNFGEQLREIGDRLRELEAVLGASD